MEEWVGGQNHLFIKGFIHLVETTEVVPSVKVLAAKPGNPPGGGKRESTFMCRPWHVYAITHTHTHSNV